MDSQDIPMSAMMDELLPRTMMENEKNYLQGPRGNLCESNLIFACRATDTRMQIYCRYFIEAFHNERCIFCNSAWCCENPEAQKNASHPDMG